MPRLGAVRHCNRIRLSLERHLGGFVLLLVLFWFPSLVQELALRRHLKEKERKQIAVVKYDANAILHARAEEEAGEPIF